MPRGNQPPKAKLHKVIVYVPIEGSELIREVQSKRAAKANGYQVPMPELWREALMRGATAMEQDLKKRSAAPPAQKDSSDGNAQAEG